MTGVADLRCSGSADGRHLWSDWFLVGDKAWRRCFYCDGLEVEDE